jgi:hypothetical protein
MSLYNTTYPVFPALKGTACSQPESKVWAFCNTSLSLAARVTDSVSRIYESEAGPLLTAPSFRARWGRIMEVPFAMAFTRGMQEGEDARFLLAATALKHFAVYSLKDYTDAAGVH